MRINQISANYFNRYNTTKKQSPLAFCRNKNQSSEQINERLNTLIKNNQLGLEINTKTIQKSPEEKATEEFSNCIKDIESICDTTKIFCGKFNMLLSDETKKNEYALKYLADVVEYMQNGSSINFGTNEYKIKRNNKDNSLITVINKDGLNMDFKRSSSDTSPYYISDIYKVFQTPQYSYKIGVDGFTHFDDIFNGGSKYIKALDKNSLNVKSIRFDKNGLYSYDDKYINISRQKIEKCNLFRMLKKADNSEYLFQKKSPYSKFYTIVDKK